MPMQIPNTPPASIESLLARADRLAGLTLGDLAQLANIAIPESFKREKGWTGQLIEMWLGATAGSKPEQDFPALGVELKTLPINHFGAPSETTYVCYAPLMGQEHTTWLSSNVYNKLQQVLWIPVIGERSVSPADRCIGTAILWRPTAEQNNQLRLDWEELMERISLGEIENISARIGEVLQLRPKAADGKALTDAIGHDGKIVKTRPRGFYLRKSFTQQILNQAFD